MPMDGVWMNAGSLSLGLAAWGLAPAALCAKAKGRTRAQRLSAAGLVLTALPLHALALARRRP